VTSFIDDTQPGWRCLTADDFAKVNGAHMPESSIEILGHALVISSND
jgi:hypothetical protein